MRSPIDFHVVCQTSDRYVPGHERVRRSGLRINLGHFDIVVGRGIIHEQLSHVAGSVYAVLAHNCRLHPI